MFQINIVALHFRLTDRLADVKRLIVEQNVCLLDHALSISFFIRRLQLKLANGKIEEQNNHLS